MQAGDGSITFVDKLSYSNLSLPCGKCIGCRLERSRQWAVRCIHEAKMHEENCFITLTYNDVHVPYDYSLNYSHFQLFMKRLRKSLGDKKISFYMCGEYGENFDRPHFHACIFGHAFGFLEPVGKSPAGSIIYRSLELEKLWTYGFSSVGQVTFESAAYTARYIMKKITGDLADEHYKFVVPETGEVVWRTPEFNRMSLKPAIGLRWLERYRADVYPHDRVVLNGSVSKPPRYYDKYLKKINPLLLEAIQLKREIGYDKTDNTDERLKAKEICANARVNRYSRFIN